MSRWSFLLLLLTFIYFRVVSIACLSRLRIYAKLDLGLDGFAEGLWVAPQMKRINDSWRGFDCDLGEGEGF